MGAFTSREAAPPRLEALFQRSTRTHHHFYPTELGPAQLYGYAQSAGFAEVELLPKYSVEDVIASGVTVQSLRELCDNQVVWINESTCISSRPPSDLRAFAFTWRCSVRFDRQAFCSVYTRTGVRGVDMESTYDLILHLAAAHEIKKLSLMCDIRDGTPSEAPMRAPSALPGPALAQCLALKTVEEVVLSGLTLDLEHVRALATCSRTDCKVKLNCFRFRDGVQGALSRSAFDECLHTNLGPTALVKDVVTDLPMLSGNSRITSLLMGSSDRAPTDTGSFLRSLGENLGLRRLNLKRFPFNDECWATLWEVLEEHPTLKTVNLCNTAREMHHVVPAMKRVRTQVVADALKENKVLETVHLDESTTDHDIYHDKVLPCLERNRYLARVKKIKKCKSESLRRQVLGRSFDHIKGNADLIWMFLSENADVAFPNEAELALKRSREQFC